MPTSGNNTAGVYAGTAKQRIFTAQSAWYGGVSDDLRAARFFRGLFFVSGQRISKHFDIFSQPDQLIPYHSLADDAEVSVADDLKQYHVLDFVYASASTKLYGLGQNGSGSTKICEKANAVSGNWDLPANSEGNGAVINGCCIEYIDYLWGFQGSTQVFKWGALDGTPSIVNSVANVGAAINSVANGIIAADGNAYLAYNNQLVRIQPDGTVTDEAKTGGVPSTYKITSLANYGNYMAIGCSPLQPYNGKSKVFIWDLSSDLFVSTIDWGEGDLRILETINGQLVGITDRYLNNASGAGNGSMLIQVASSGNTSATPVKEVFTQALTGKTIPLSKCVKNNRLFWAAKIMTNSAGTEYNEGIWSYGSKNSAYPNALSLDIIDENVNTSGIQGFGNAANFFYIAHSADGSVDKTDSSAYSFTSILESNIFNWASTIQDKRLINPKISFTPLTAGQSVTLKMKVDADSSWTTIGTCNTVGQSFRIFTNLEAASNAPFPSGIEYQFRIESVGGAAITGFNAQAEYFANA